MLSIKLSKKVVLLFALLVFSLALVNISYAKVYVIQNQSVNQFVVNGSSGNIILNPNAGFGNVGIGTTGPLVKLQVSTGASGTGVDSSTNQLIVESSAISGVLIASGGTSRGDITFSNDNSDADGAITFNGAVSRGFTFRTGAVADRVVIDSSGNLGIGTTSPLNPLHVIGAATFAGGVNASSLNVTGFCVAEDSLITLADGSKKKIKEIKEGEFVQSLDEKSGKLVSNKVNALLDMSNKTIFELKTESGRAVNTTAEHPYLTLIYDKEKCDEYLNNGFNNDIPESYTSQERCLRWTEVKNLGLGQKIVVPYLNKPISLSRSEVLNTLTSSCFLIFAPLTIKSN